MGHGKRPVLCGIILPDGNSRKRTGRQSVMRKVAVTPLLLSLTIFFVIANISAAQYAGTSGRVVLHRRAPAVTITAEEPSAAASAESQAANYNPEETVGGSGGSEKTSADPKQELNDLGSLVDRITDPSTTDAEFGQMLTSVSGSGLGMLDRLMVGDGQGFSDGLVPHFGSARPSLGAPTGIPGTYGSVGQPPQLDGLPTAVNQVMQQLFPQGFIDLSFLPSGD